MKQEEAKKAVDKFVEKLSSTDSEDQWELIDDFFEKPEGQFELIKVARQNGEIDDPAWIDMVLTLVDANVGNSQLEVEAGDACRIGDVVPKDFDRAWKYYESACEYEGPDGKCKYLLFSSGRINDIGFYWEWDAASADWWEYAATRVKPSLDLCVGMANGLYEKDPENREKWLMKGLDLCSDESKYETDSAMELARVYFSVHKDDTDRRFVDLASRILDDLIDDNDFDSDCGVDGFLEAILDIGGFEDETARWKAKIEEDCANHTRFRHLMGKRLFDAAEKKLAKCYGCINKSGHSKDFSEKECALVSVPSDKPGTVDMLPFCRECYGEFYFGMVD